MDNIMTPWDNKKEELPKPKFEVGQVVWFSNPEHNGYSQVLDQEEIKKVQYDTMNEFEYYFESLEHSIREKEVFLSFKEAYNYLNERE